MLAGDDLNICGGDSAVYTADANRDALFLIRCELEYYGRLGDGS